MARLRCAHLTQVARAQAGGMPPRVDRDRPSPLCLGPGVRVNQCQLLSRTLECHAGGDKRAGWCHTAAGVGTGVCGTEQSRKVGRPRREHDVGQGPPWWIAMSPNMPPTAFSPDPTHKPTEGFLTGSFRCFDIG